MASHYYPFNQKSSYYPYVYSVVTKKNQIIDFTYQHVKDSNNRTVNHNYETSIKNISKEIIGPPTKFPIYGDFSETFYMGICSDISTSSSQTQAQSITYNNESVDNNMHYNYLDLEFQDAVYPIRVSIYEVYNPGYVTCIWAQDNDNEWFLLWTGQHQNVPPKSRIFSPPLQFCNFKTKMLRLKFMANLRDYHIQLDAVMLIGTSKLILPKNPKQSLTDLLKSINTNLCNQDIHNLTPNYENANLDIFDLQENFPKYCTISKKYNNLKV